MNVPPGWESLGPEAKRELLAQLLRQKTEARVFPLSYGQEALWFLYQMAPDSVAYNVAFTARLHSPVDVAALERAFARVVARHEMLRVTFEALGEEPAQRIHDEVPVRIEEIDGRAWTTTDLMRSMAALYQRPFDLQKGPPFRLTLVRGRGGHVRPPAGRPSHRLRRVVDGGAPQGLVHPVSRGTVGDATHARPADHPVFRFRPLAGGPVERAARGRRCGPTGMAS